jgi:hypothetical protein
MQRPHDAVDEKGKPLVRSVPRAKVSLPFSLVPQRSLINRIVWMRYASTPFTHVAVVSNFPRYIAPDFLQYICEQAD